MKPATVSTLLLFLLGVAWLTGSHSWGADASSLQKRAGGADQPGARWQEVAVTSKNYNYNHQAYPTAYGKQYSAKTPTKGRVTLSSSASRVQPGLLQWVKFW
ncbi:dermokine isoform X5 [Cynocephalus volans]|uniref:dermokine isoform X5 n=1 Tax=Cynocephalus volans TaxID=110931 RepID=UPI002FCC1B77